MKINKKTYDYIICGAGSAGCIIANRLVQLASSININTHKHHQNDKILKILLIEAVILAVCFAPISITSEN